MIPIKTIGHHQNLVLLKLKKYIWNVLTLFILKLLLYMRLLQELRTSNSLKEPKEIGPTLLFIRRNWLFKELHLAMVMVVMSPHM